MVALRIAVFGLLGHDYHFGAWGQAGASGASAASGLAPAWWAAFGYEWLKDVRSYALMLAVLMIYRHLLLRSQGEASVLAPPERGEPIEPVDRPQRLLVKKLRREFLIAVADIDALQAQGNYVGLRVRGSDYLMRSTLSALEARLDPARFVRVHRSHVVNLDAVSAIEPQDDGDAIVVLRDGSRVPCSRRYREALRTASGA